LLQRPVQIISDPFLDQTKVMNDLGNAPLIFSGASLINLNLEWRYSR
jgi:hypothetical protein